MSGWRDPNPHDPLDRRMRATTQLRAVGLEPRPGESTEARYQRYARMFAHLFNDGPAAGADRPTDDAQRSPLRRANN